MSLNSLGETGFTKETRFGNFENQTPKGGILLPCLLFHALLCSYLLMRLSCFVYRFQSRWNARIIPRILGFFLKSSWVVYMCFLFMGKLSRTCSIDSCWRLYTLLLCVFTNDSYTLVQYRGSCMIQYSWYLERLMDYIVCGLYV